MFVYLAAVSNLVSLFFSLCINIFKVWNLSRELKLFVNLNVSEHWMFRFYYVLQGFFLANFHFTLKLTQLYFLQCILKRKKTFFPSIDDEFSKGFICGTKKYKNSEKMRKISLNKKSVLDSLVKYLAEKGSFFDWTLFVLCSFVIGFEKCTTYLLLF